MTDVEKADEYDTPGKLTGTFVKTTTPADGLFISGNKFWYSTGKTNCKAFRCWFELGAVLDKETDFGSRIFLSFDDGETTGINSIDNLQIDNLQSVYDMQGRRIVNNRKSVNSKLQRGVYLKGGKKVVVK